MFKARVNLAICVGSDREACLGVDVLFEEVDISLWYGVNDDNVDALGRWR